MKIFIGLSKRRIGLFKKSTELCTLCGAYVAVVFFSSSNKVYSYGHSSAELIVDKFLGENQPGFDAPNSTSLSHQTVNPYEQLNFSDLKKLIELLEAADEEVERVASKHMEYDYEFPYQTIGMFLSPLRVDLCDLIVYYSVFIFISMIMFVIFLNLIFTFKYVCY
uniref:MADS-box domain-containing protein n=1 Tax=Solanum lycopersicum TaxID=4081 RepID=A0A3Q7J8H4_SOLLC